MACCHLHFLCRNTIQIVGLFLKVFCLSVVDFKIVVSIFWTLDSCQIMGFINFVSHSADCLFA